jgi:carbonic anhydrase/acetyltransferase-like protein (isoleucine patch superfamily)
MPKEHTNQKSQLQNASFATSTELIGCARMKPDATLEWMASLRAQTETGFCNHLEIFLIEA